MCKLLTTFENYLINEFIAPENNVKCVLKKFIENREIVIQYQLSEFDRYQCFLRNYTFKFKGNKLVDLDSELQKLTQEKINNIENVFKQCLINTYETILKDLIGRSVSQ